MAKKMKARASSKPIKYRVKDVGRKGHHYLEVAVLEPRGKGKGVRGGSTVGKLVSRRTIVKNVNKAREAWMNMSPAVRARKIPDRKGNRSYMKKTITKRSVLGKPYKSTVYVKRKR